MPNAVAYYRVSTHRQGRSGLGIEAQRSTVARFAAAEGITILSEFVEIETGKGSDALDRRPQLAAALAAARSAKCPVLFRCTRCGSRETQARPEYTQMLASGFLGGQEQFAVQP
jgi:DNA invertase Pin-like site-specific DNA recombinase